jgi:branched-chain amino acid transport system substrate-binding protein
MVELKKVSRKDIVLSLYLLLFSLVGPTIFWLTNSRFRESSIGAISQPTLSSQDVSTGQSNPQSEPQIQKRLSLGSKLLITADDYPAKQTAIQAFASGNYVIAVNQFNTSLQNHRNDPEALIYTNNATAALKGSALKIAVSVPIGRNLNIAREILRGVAQAQNELNRTGGLDGKLLQVEIANDDNDPEIAKQIASMLVNDPNTLAVVGHNASEASLAAAPIYQDGTLVMISPTSVGRNLSGIGSYIFRTTPTSRATADILASHLITVARKTKIAICSASKTEASQSFQEELSWAVFNYGGKIINTPCDFSTPGFNATDIPSRAISDGADALVLAPSLNTINQALEVVQANQKRLPLFGNQTMYVVETLQQGQLEASGMLLAVPWHAAAFANNAYLADAKKLWGGSGNWRTAMAYDATQAVITGLKMGASREQLQKTLSSPGFSVKGATGVVQFLPSGDRNMKGILVKVQSGKNSGTGYDFVPLKIAKGATSIR